jgi:hypothetical protein
MRVSLVLHIAACMPSRGNARYCTSGHDTRLPQDLGIPTANVDSDSLRACLAEAVTGIYTGWASVGSCPTAYKMVMSIGWNPHYGNSEKTAEPWLLHEFDKVCALAGWWRQPAAWHRLANLLLDCNCGQQSVQACWLCHALHYPGVLRVP